jgi:hypothetical protein
VYYQSSLDRFLIARVFPFAEAEATVVAIGSMFRSALHWVYTLAVSPVPLERNCSIVVIPRVARNDRGVELNAPIASV